MDGLLRTEFAVLLRDSLNATPRRHKLRSALPPPPPLSPLSPPSPCKKPRLISGKDFGIHCDMQLEPRLQFHHPIPTSPTSPLPSPPCPPPHTTSSTPATAVVVAATATATTAAAAPHRGKRNFDRGAVRSLDVLATVSAEQSLCKEKSLKAEVVCIPMSPVLEDGRRKKKVKSGRVFQCKMCTSTFSQQFNLNKHVRAVHERRRPFECNTCHAKFQQKSHRTMHHLAVHEKLRQFSCDNCNASFSWRGVLKKHRKSIHGIDE